MNVRWYNPFGNNLGITDFERYENIEKGVAYQAMV